MHACYTVFEDYVCPHTHTHTHNKNVWNFLIIAKGTQKHLQRQNHLSYLSKKFSYFSYASHRI